MEARLEPVEGIAGAGKLQLRGPTSCWAICVPMRRQDRAPQGRWYDTGDIVAIDEKALSPSAGVSSGSPRSAAKRSHGSGGKYRHRAVARQCACRGRGTDGRKGEQIVLVTDAQDARRIDMVAGRRIMASQNWRCPGG
jgi:acyl-[acyl-carrier-protein]-phospholipid O-acyltransferase/long-chain-fatty-acid--[acyl-carrier-protein] ligase